MILTHKHINLLIRRHCWNISIILYYTLTRGGSPVPHSCWHTRASVPLETSQLVAKNTRVDCHWAGIVLIRERQYSAILWRSEIGTHTGCKGVDQLLARAGYALNLISDLACAWYDTMHMPTTMLIGGRSRLGKSIDSNKNQGFRQQYTLPFQNEVFQNQHVQYHRLVQYHWPCLRIYS